MKEKKARIVQLPEYKNLVNKLVPYSENVMFKINVVGEEVTDVSIMFKKPLSVATESIRVEFRGMFVRSEIKTDELINELRKAVGERNFKIFTSIEFIRCLISSSSTTKSHTHSIRKHVHFRMQR